MKNNSGKKTDIRIIKTNLAVKKAMFTLLEMRNFDKITVNDICEEAMVSRGAFYQNFEDKYQLIEICLMDLAKELRKPDITNDENAYVNNLIDFIYNNATLMNNLIMGNNTELVNLFISTMENELISKLSETRGAEKNITELDKAGAAFISGGLTSILVKQLRETFPITKEVMVSLFMNVQKTIVSMEYNN